jgi:outer membrane lipoprotein
MAMGLITAKPALRVLLPVLLLGACATTPSFDIAGVDPRLTPQGVAARPQPAMGSRVQWGGSILATTNLEASTLVEVLAYPLDSRAKPRTDQEPMGRFVLEERGYLEPATYARDRLITVVGTLSGTRAGRVGESPHTQPVVTPQQTYLWPTGQTYEGSRVFFGIGANSGGSWGGGVGVGF